MSLRERLREYVTGQRWTIGFIENPLKEIVGGGDIVVHYLQGVPRDRWYADPFILNCDDKFIILLVEEYPYVSKIGRIAKLTIERDSYKLVKDEVILELSTHLSFPAILRREGKVYLYPENAKGEGLSLYEYDECLNKCIFVKNITREKLADAVFTELFGEAYVFATIMPNHNGSNLSVFKVDSNRISLFNTCGFSSNVARNAGDWFAIENDIYRPAQNCNGGYGKSVIIQKVSKKSDKFVFESIREIKSTNPLFNTGCHTFNHYNGLSVIDVHGYTHNIVSNIYNHFRKFVQ